MANGVDALLGDRNGQPTVGIFEGEIVEDAVDETEGVYVVIPSIHPERKFGPCAWSQRHEVPHMPSAGDPCAVAITKDTYIPWVIGWWPYEY